MAPTSKNVVSSSRFTPVLRSLAIQAVGLAGTGAVLEGIRQIYPPLALIVGGAAAVAWTVAKVRQE